VIEISSSPREGVNSCTSDKGDPKGSAVDLSADRRTVLVVSALVPRSCLTAACHPVVFDAHPPSFLAPPPAFLRINKLQQYSQYGGSGRDHSRNVSSLRFYSFAFLTRIRPHSPESESDEAGNAIAQDPSSSQRTNRKRRFVYSVNHPPIGRLIGCTSDPRGVGVRPVRTT